MSVKDLISAAFNKDASTFEATLHTIMQEKMGAAIQARFSPAVYEEEVDLEEANSDDSEDDESTEDDDMKEEEVEQIDELSKNLLKKYRSAAWKDAGKAYNKTDYAKTDDEHDKLMNRGDKRMKGYELATAKTGLKPHQTYVDSGIDTIPHAKVRATVKKEEVELDEVSGAKLGAYMVKARKSAEDARKKDDESYNNPETDNKEYRKPLRKTIRKREHGAGLAMDKLKGSSWAKVPAGEK